MEDLTLIYDGLYAFPKKLGSLFKGYGPAYWEFYKEKKKHGKKEYKRSKDSLRYRKKDLFRLTCKNLEPIIKILNED